MLGMLTDWVGAHRHVFWWLVAFSVVAFVGTLIAVPWMVVRIPPDYFARRAWRDAKPVRRHPVVHVLFVIGRNVLGYAFIALGILMLVLPGQGLLTILAGVVLVDFPGKHRALEWLVARPTVLKSMNWIRERRGKGPLIVEA